MKCFAATHPLGSLPVVPEAGQLPPTTVCTLHAAALVAVCGTAANDIHGGQHAAPFYGPDEFPTMQPTVTHNFMPLFLP